MAKTINESLNLKQCQVDVWTVREQLCLASAVLRNEDQNWAAVSRILRLHSTEKGRPHDWYSTKNCAMQYAILLEQVNTPKRKREKNETIETPAETVRKMLNKQRIDELQGIVEETKISYTQLYKEVTSLLESDQLDHCLDRLWDEIIREQEKEDEEKLKLENKLKEREEKLLAIQQALRPLKGSVSKPQTTLKMETKSQPPLEVSQSFKDNATSSETSSDDSMEEDQDIAAGNITTSVSSPTIKSEELPASCDVESNKNSEHNSDSKIPTEVMDPTEVKADKDSRIMALADSPIKKEKTESLLEDDTLKEDLTTTLKESGSDSFMEEASKDPKIEMKTSDCGSDLKCETSHENADCKTMEIVDGGQSDQKECSEQKDNIKKEGNLSLEKKEFQSACALKKKDSTNTVPSKEIKNEATKIKPDIEEVESNFDCKTTSSSQVKSEVVDIPTKIIPKNENLPSTKENFFCPIQDDNKDLDKKLLDSSCGVKEDDADCRIEDNKLEEATFHGFSSIAMDTKRKGRKKRGSKFELYIKEEEKISKIENVKEENPVSSDGKEEKMKTEEMDVKKEDLYILKKVEGEIKQEKRGEEDDGEDRKSTRTIRDDDEEISRDSEEVKHILGRVDKRKFSTSDGVASPVISESTPSSPASTYFGDDPEAEKAHRSWKRSIMIVWNDIAAHKNASVFLRPITEEKVPGYNSIVFRPTDLQTIKRHIETGLIRTAAEFHREILLMFLNAKMYNQNDHNIYRMSDEMVKDATSILEKFNNAQMLAKVLETPQKSLRRETRESSAKRMEEDLKRKRESDDKANKRRK